MKRVRQLLFLLSSLFLLIGSVSCTYQDNSTRYLSSVSNPPQSAAIASNSSRAQSQVQSNDKKYQPLPLSDDQKKVLNFVPELPVNQKSCCDYSNFKAAGTTQQLFRLQAGDKNTCAFAFDRERYAYIGCNTSPAKIIKYDLCEMKEVWHIELPANENRAGCRVAALIAVSPDIIIHASYNDPCVFTKIDGKTMKITGSLKGKIGTTDDKYIRGMTYDGKYVYAATDSNPGKIIKFDPVTMTETDDILLKNDGISSIFALTICGNFLVGVCNRDDDKNAVIFRLDLNDLHQKPDVLSVDGYSNYQSVCTDGKFVYAATFTNPMRVVKVDATSLKLKFISGFTAVKNEESGNFSIVYDGSNIVAGTWNLGTVNYDRLIKIDPADMKRIKTLTLPCKFPADLMYLSPYLYTCCDHPTGDVLRIKF